MVKKWNRCQSQGDESHPQIPDKLYFTIGEVAGLCGLKPHVLRYWEQEFSQLSPVKRGSNRRFYSRKDIELVLTLRRLIYEDGLTTSGARKRLVAPIAQKMQDESKVNTDKTQKLVADLLEICKILEPAK